MKYQGERLTWHITKQRKALLVKTRGPNSKYKAINSIKRKTQKQTILKTSTVKHIFCSP